MSRKSRVFWPLLLTVLLADCSTKELAVAELSPPGNPHRVLGDVVRFTLAFNRGPAMGLPARLPVEALGAFALAAAGLLVVWYLRIPPDARALPAALALVAAGAVGNGWQRLLAARGVVDFIDVRDVEHVEPMDAQVDVGITIGGAFLALLLWAEDARFSNRPVPPS